MKCNACGSHQFQPIKIFAGHNAIGWSPVGGEKDIFGNYKKLRPLLAHACTRCGSVNWNITLPKPDSAHETAQALDDLANEEFDPGQESTAYMFEQELN